MPHFLTSYSFTNYVQYFFGSTVCTAAIFLMFHGGKISWLVPAGKASLNIYLAHAIVIAIVTPSVIWATNSLVALFPEAWISSTLSTAIETIIKLSIIALSVYLLARHNVTAATSNLISWLYNLIPFKGKLAKKA